MGMLCVLTSIYARQNINKPLTVNYNQQRLSYILAELTKKSGISFSYSNSELDLEKKISIKQTTRPLGVILDELTEKAGLRWQQVGDQIILKKKLKQVSGQEGEESPVKFYQTVRGVVLDKESNVALPGVSVYITSLDPVRGTATNSSGEFRFANIPVGRHQIEFSTMGFKTVVQPQMLVSSGKEVVLTVAMSEYVTDLQTVVVNSSRDPQKPLNDMASISARAFSVEETSRYAGSVFDPARMAQSFAGVTAGNDINNDIIIRGNSSKGLQWRLEGTEIINPNHFGEEGSSAGGISMISTSMLTNSDFFTGAFPAEYGNALSGVFDLQFRKGNTEKREYAVMAGILGTEASLEGPFRKGGKASYLVNYRYSTLGILERMGISPAGEGRIPIYQDLAFNLNFPTESAGTFSLFGIGGLSSQNQEAERNFVEWETIEDKFDRSYGYHSGSAGLKHLLPLGDKVYLKNIISYSGSRITDHIDSLTNTYDKNVYGRDSYENSVVRYSGLLNYKASAKSTFRGGLVLSYMAFDINSLVYRDHLNRLSQLIDAKGDAWNHEAYGQWKHQFNSRLSVNTGFHASYFNLSKSYSIEPRAGLNWWIKPNQQISFGAGVHSRLEPMAFYYAQNEQEDGSVVSSNKELEPSKALHLVGGYERNFRNKLKFKAEAYYQHLFNIPVSPDPDHTFTALNTANAYVPIYNKNYRSLVNDGEGNNLGVELTLEKSLSQGYYFLITSSLFDSKFTNIEGKQFSTDYNSNYIGNFVSGREWKTGPGNKNLFGINTKVVYTGGRRYSPINLEKSIEEDYPVVYEDKINTLQAAPYFRVDFSMTYRINRPKLTHAIFMDIQNVTNRYNIGGLSYNSDKQKIEEFTLAGIIPSLYYRIEF